MRAAGSSDRRTCSIDRAATSAGRACAAVAGVAASSGRRRTQAAIASMWNAARRAHGSLLSVPARRNRALALPGVLAAASAVLGACYSARIWHGGVFRLSKTTVFQRWVLALSLCERAELIGQSSSSFQTALLSMRAAQALLPARYSRPAPRQRKHGVKDAWKGPPTSRALPEHKNAGRRGRTFGARDDETPSLVTNFTRIRRRWNATGAGVAPGRDFAGTGKTSRLRRARSINVDLRFIVLTSFP